MQLQCIFSSKKTPTNEHFKKVFKLIKPNIYEIDEDHNCKITEYITLKIAVSYHLKFSAYYDS